MNSLAIPQWADLAIREEKKDMEGDGSFLGLNKVTPTGMDLFEPVSDLFTIADGGRQ